MFSLATQAQTHAQAQALACEQTPGEDRKIFSPSAKQKNSESEAIGSWRERKNTSASATKKNSESEAIGAGQEATQAQTQYFLFHLESGLGAGIITRASTSTRIKIFPFSCGCAYACVCAATSENLIPLRHSTSTWLRLANEKTGSRLLQCHHDNTIRVPIQSTM